MSKTAAPMTVHRSQAERVGRRVLAGLDKGRQIAIKQNQARSAAHSATIFYLARIDEVAGRPHRGRPGRISRKLGGLLSESQVRRLLQSKKKISAHTLQSARFIGVV